MRFYHILLLLSALFNSVKSADFEINLEFPLQPNHYIIGYNSSTSEITGETRYYNLKSDDHVQSVIQQALDDINSAGGGIVEMMRGTFIMEKSISIGSNIYFKGQGMYETTLKLKDRAAGFPLAGLIRSRLQNNVRVSAITLDGNKNKQHSSLNSVHRKIIKNEENIIQAISDNIIKQGDKFQIIGFREH